MTASDHESRDWGERVGAWLGARWKGLVVAVLLLFALNSLAGLVVGAMGLILFAHRVAGRLMGARRVVDHIQQFVSDPDERG